LADAGSERSPVGLAFQVSGKLKVTKRLGICTAVDSESAILHLSPKDKDTISVPVASLPAPANVVPATISPATRLLYAARQPDGPIKAHWDRDTLLARSGELAKSSVPAMRLLADEAIQLGWPRASTCHGCSSSLEERESEYSSRFRM
jgi:hypothetical protein